MPFVDKVLKVMFDDLPYNLTSKRKNYFSKINFISGIDQHPKLTGDCTKSKSNNFLFPWLEQNLKWLLFLEGAGLKMSIWIFENGDRETYPLAAQPANALSDILRKWNGISSNIWIWIHVSEGQYQLIMQYAYIREPNKYYFTDFVFKGGEGHPTKLFEPILKAVNAMLPKQLRETANYPHWGNWRKLFWLGKISAGMGAWGIGGMI